MSDQLTLPSPDRHENVDDIRARSFGLHVQWINKANVVFQPIGEILVGTYDTQVSVAGIGTRSCIAYEYTNEAINVTYYSDKSLQWPVKIVYVTSFENQTYKIEVNISDPNIPGLQTSS